MENAPGPIYELTVRVERDDIAALDSWLARQADEAPATPGIAGVEIFRRGNEEADRAARVAHYCFSSDHDLEQYLAGPDTIHDAVIARFGDAVQADRRVLRHEPIVDGELQTVELCLNCGTALAGQYCGNCGQRSTSRLISVWELLRDAFGDLLEMDSRLWRTLIPLLVRPGQLTRDYLEGRRARYMPPFRTYLVLSIVFFLIAFFDPRDELGILFPDAPAPPVPEAVQDADEAVAAPNQPAGETDEERVVIGTPGVVDEEDPSGNLEIRFSSDGEADENCDVEDIDTSDWPLWLSSRLTEERLLAACNRVIADDGRAFGRKLLDNVPAALFLLLPLMALVLKVLYPLSKRYYVEHLLFVLHYHAFVFLVLCLQVLLVRLTTLVGIPETPVEIAVFAISLYVPVYLYRALRRVYGQGRFFTFLKFLILVLAYFTGLLLIFGLVALLAAFSL